MTSKTEYAARAIMNWSRNLMPRETENAVHADEPVHSSSQSPAKDRCSIHMYTSTLCSSQSPALNILPGPHLTTSQHIHILHSD